MERQALLSDFIATITFHHIPLNQKVENRRGLAERFLRRRLERQGWSVWRGGLLNITRQDEVYPNVRRRYEQLVALLAEHHPGKLALLQYYCAVHHGMPDFLCLRRGRFKFVECKLGHEQLSRRQKRCIPALLQLGFAVEVHKLVDPCTKTRRMRVNLQSGQKEVLDQQLSVRKFFTIHGKVRKRVLISVHSKIRRSRPSRRKSGRKSRRSNCVEVLSEIFSKASSSS